MTYLDVTVIRCIFMISFRLSDIVMASESSREDVDDPECPTNDFPTDESDFDIPYGKWIVSGLI